MSPDEIEIRELIGLAQDARESAYAPYSEYKVGAVLQTEYGNIYKGCNVEVSGRNTSTHAEMLALFNAVLNGERDFDRLVISHDGDEAPCGLCLHTISEFVEDIEIIVDAPMPKQYDLDEAYENAYRPQTANHHDHH